MLIKENMPTITDGHGVTNHRRTRGQLHFFRWKPWLAKDVKYDTGTKWHLVDRLEAERRESAHRRNAERICSDCNKTHSRIGQGPLQPRHPRPPAPTPNLRDHSRTQRPTGPPRSPRQQQPPTTYLEATDYKQRNTVERAISKLKQFRAVATRYDKREYTFAGTVDVPSIRIWLRDPVP